MGCTSGGSETPPEESIVAQPAARALLPAALGRVPDSDVHRNVLLLPGPGNPRNSERDFITLADGRVMFVYTRFTGGGGDQADLAARFSSDQGRSWSEDDVMVVANEGDQNVMSASLLRLPLARFPSVLGLSGSVRRLDCLLYLENCCTWKMIFNEK